MSHGQLTFVGTSAGTIWVKWNAPTGSSSTEDTWTAWTGDNNASSAATTTIWCSWNADTGLVEGFAAGNSHYPYPPTRQQTPEELAELVALRKRHGQEAKEREAKRLKAEKNALKLFVGIVGRKAYGQFKKRGYHEVIGHSGKRYRMRLDKRVEEMTGNFGDTVAAFLCIHSDNQYGLPAMDTLIQQMLLVMSGEEGESVLHRTANRTAAAA